MFFYRNDPNHSTLIILKKVIFHEIKDSAYRSHFTKLYGRSIIPFNLPNQASLLLSRKAVSLKHYAKIYCSLDFLQNKIFHLRANDPTHIKCKAFKCLSVLIKQLRVLRLNINARPFLKDSFCRNKKKDRKMNSVLASLLFCSFIFYVRVCVCVCS